MIYCVKKKKHGLFGVPTPADPRGMGRAPPLLTAVIRPARVLAGVGRDLHPELLLHLPPPAHKAQAAAAATAARDQPHRLPGSSQLLFCSLLFQ